MTKADHGFPASQESRAIAAQRDEERKIKFSDRSNQRCQKFIEQMPGRYLGLFLKAAVKDVSALKAIKAKCQSCVGYEDTTTRIAECTSHLCPLWAYRPGVRG